MDAYSRRNLVAAVLVVLFLVLGLIGEAMQDRTARHIALGCITAVVALVFVIAILVWELAISHAAPLT